MYVVVARSHSGIEVFGPYQSSARASAVGLNRFGPVTIGGVRWTVHRMKK